MIFRTYKPSAALSDYVKYYWTMDSELPGEADSTLVYPEGYPEMVFHYGDAFVVTDGRKGAVRQPQSFFGAQKTKSLYVSTNGTTGMIAVTFRPFGASPFFRFDLNQGRDLKIDLCSIFGDRHKLLVEQIAGAGSTEKRIGIIESFLLSQLSVNARELAILSLGAGAIDSSMGRITIEEASKTAYVSCRHFERLFLRRVGLSPRQYSRIRKINFAIKLMEAQRLTSLTEVALEAGFYDQSHFISNFKSVIDITPSEYNRLSCIGS